MTDAIQARDTVRCMRKHDDCAVAEAVLGKINRCRKLRLQVGGHAPFSAINIVNADNDFETFYAEIESTLLRVSFWRRWITRQGRPCMAPEHKSITNKVHPKK